MGNEKRILLKKINLLENKKLIWGLNIAGIILFFIFFFIFSKLAFLYSASFYQTFDFWTLMLGFVLFFGLIIIHELIHAVFFKTFQPTKR